MSFQREDLVTPDRRGAVAIVLYIPDPEVPAEVESGKLTVQIKYTDDSIKERTFDLLARLQDDAEGQTYLASLVSLKNYILARIGSELLP